MKTTPAGKKGRIYYGWYIVMVSFLCWFAADAFGIYTLGLFIGPISRDLGWTTVMITGALTLRSTVSGFSGPIIGPLSDKKHGARIIMSIGILVAGTAVIGVSRVRELWQFYLVYGVFGALGMVGFGSLVSNTLISKWFVLKRGRAIGIATMGVSIGGVFFVPMAHYLISNYGWRNALIFQGIMIWVLALLPAIILVRRRPEDIGLRPDGSEPETDNNASPDLAGAGTISAGERIWTLKEAVRTKTMWLLLVAFNVTGISTSGVMIFFYPYLETQGFSPDIAASAMTVFATTCAIVKIPWGLITEKISARYCVMAGYIISAIGLAILLNSRSEFFAFIFAVIYGAGLGGNIVLREVIWADYYGRTFLGTIRGIIMPMNLISIAGGPLLAAWIRDITGDYRLSFTLFLGTFIIGVIFMYLSRPPVASSSKSS